MKTSQIGIDLIKHFESLHDGDLHIIGLQPKPDPKGLYTEGYGRAMRDSKGNFIYDKKTAYKNISIRTVEEAEIALIQDLSVFEVIVMIKIKIQLKPNQFDALVSFTYNTGGSKTLFNMVNSNNILLKDWWVKHYITSGGIIYNGLIARRKSEAKLFFI